MRRIGIIGGISWPAAASYYRELNAQIQRALGGNHSADLVLRSLDFQTLIDGLDQPGMIQSAVSAAAADLHAAGAEIVGLASLTAHRFATGLDQLPVLFRPLPAAIRTELDARRLTAVGVLATGLASRDQGVMSHLAGSSRVILPAVETAARLDEIIFNELAHMRLSAVSLARLEAVCAELIERGAEAILLGTTEFSFVAEHLSVEAPLLDAVQIHCRDLIACALQVESPRDPTWPGDEALHWR